MTKTRTFAALVEVVNQFIHDFNLPEPRAANISIANNMIDLIFDGDGATADLISESLYWETYESGITSARVNYDSTAIAVLVYEL